MRNAPQQLSRLPNLADPENAGKSRRARCTLELQHPFPFLTCDIALIASLHLPFHSTALLSNSKD